MIIDITGVELTPGNMGRDCPGNGLHTLYECCCEECDYMLCCLESHNPQECEHCKDLDCPRAGQKAPSERITAKSNAFLDITEEQV